MSVGTHVQGDSSRVQYRHSALHPTLMVDTQPDSSVQPNEEQTNDHVVFSLENILGDNHDAIEHPTVTGDVASTPAGGWDEEDTERPLIEGYCIECEGVYLTIPRLQDADHYHLTISLRSTHCEMPAIVQMTPTSRPFQTNLHKCSVKLAQILIAKSVSPPSIAKVLENDTRHDP